MKNMYMSLKDLKNNKKYFITLSILCVCIVIVLFISFNQGEKTKVEIGTKSNDTKEEIEKRKKNKVDKDILAASMNQIINFDNGQSEGELNIENFPENNYEIEVEITNDKQEVIYKSEKLEPGMIIRKDKLEKELKKGTYFCSSTFKAFDKDAKEVKKISAQIVITIKN